MFQEVPEAGRPVSEVLLDPLPGRCIQTKELETGQGKAVEAIASGRVVTITIEYSRSIHEQLGLNLL